MTRVAVEYTEWKAVLRRSITGWGEEAAVQGNMPSQPLYGRPLWKFSKFRIKRNLKKEILSRNWGATAPSIYDNDTQNAEKSTRSPIPLKKKVLQTRAMHDVAV